MRHVADALPPSQPRARRRRVLSHDASPPASSHANRARPPAPRAEAKVPHHTGHHPRAAATSTRPADPPCSPRPGWPPPPRSGPPAGPPHPGHPPPPARRITEPADGHRVFPLARVACADDPMPRAGSPTINGRERQQSAPQSRPDRRERASLRSRTDHTASAASGCRVPYRLLGVQGLSGATIAHGAHINHSRRR